MYRGRSSCAEVASGNPTPVPFVGRSEFWRWRIGFEPFRELLVRTPGFESFRSNPTTKKHQTSWCFFVVGATGLEPAASRTRSERSTIELRPDIGYDGDNIEHRSKFGKGGGGGRGEAWKGRSKPLRPLRPPSFSSAPNPSPSAFQTKMPPSWRRGCHSSGTCWLVSTSTTRLRSATSSRTKRPNRFGAATWWTAAMK